MSEIDTPWALVEGAGTDAEEVVMYASHLSVALELSQLSDGDWQVMKEMPDGTLTTEF